MQLESDSVESDEEDESDEVEDAVPTSGAVVYRDGQLVVEVDDNAWTIRDALQEGELELDRLADDDDTVGLPLHTIDHLYCSESDSED